MRKLGIPLLLLLLLLLIWRPMAQGLKGQPDKLPGLKELLVGKWQAQGDDGEVMEFKADGTCIMSVKGQSLGDAVYKIVSRDTLIISSPDGDELERFAAQISMDELTLVQTAKFKRAK
jgi:hypothetical protein